MMNRMIRIFACVCLAVVAFCVLANVRVIHAASSKIVWPNALSDKKVDCIIVLGARVYEDGTPCTVLKDRLDTGIDLYRAGVSDRLLLSGDHGKVDYDEVTAMIDELVDIITYDVPEEYDLDVDEFYRYGREYYAEGFQVAQAA